MTLYIIFIYKILAKFMLIIKYILLNIIITIDKNNYFMNMLNYIYNMNFKLKNKTDIIYKLINVIICYKYYIFTIVEYIYKIKYVNIDHKNDLDETIISKIDMLKFDSLNCEKIILKNNNYFNNYYQNNNSANDDMMDSIKKIKILPHEFLNTKIANKNATGNYYTIENLHIYKNIKSLNCNNLLIRNISETFDYLEKLYCSNCGLEENNYWGKNLIYLNCSSNKIKKLCNLPQKLKVLLCKENIIEELNCLNEYLVELDCSYNKIIKLNNLPENLIKLNCSFNKIKELDNLPIGLKIIDCSNNELVNLDFLPYGLEILHCNNNNVVNLDNLPNSLQFLSLNGIDTITNLDNLPNSLKFLNCEKLFNLINIKNLPKNLEYFYCDNCSKLTLIDIIPNKIKVMNCSYSNNLEKIEFYPYNHDLYDVYIEKQLFDLSALVNLTNYFNNNPNNNLNNNPNNNPNNIIDIFNNSQTTNTKIKIFFPKKYSFWYNVNFHFNNLINFIIYKYYSKMQFDFIIKTSYNSIKKYYFRKLFENDIENKFGINYYSKKTIYGEYIIQLINFILISIKIVVFVISSIYYINKDIITEESNKHIN